MVNLGTPFNHQEILNELNVFSRGKLWVSLIPHLVTEFQRYWRHEHLVACLPGVKRYVQSHVLGEYHQGQEPI